MAYRHGQSTKQPQRSSARKHDRSNMQSQAYHNSKRNGGSQPLNNFSTNHQGANTNLIDNPCYHMNNNAIQGPERYGPMNGGLNGNYQGQPYASQYNPMRQQHFPSFQQGQFMCNAPELTPTQLAYNKFKANEPLRNAVHSFRAQQMHERANIWDRHFRELRQLRESSEYRAKNWFVEKTIEDWEKEEKRDWTRFRLARLEKDNEEQHAAIERLETASKEEREATTKEGRKPTVKKFQKSNMPEYSERETEYDELFGDHHSIFDLNDVPYTSAPSSYITVTSRPPTSQPSANPAQDTLKRVVKRDREDDVMDEHIVKRPRQAGTDTCTVPSAESEQQQLPDTIDTSFVPQATLIEENPKRIPKRGREEEVEEERDVKRSRQESDMSPSPQAWTKDVTLSPGLAGNEDAMSDPLQALSSPEVNTPSLETETLPVNDWALSTKIANSSSGHISVTQALSSPASLHSTSPGSTPSVSAVPYTVRITTNTSRISPVVASIYSSPISTYSPGLSSHASPCSPVSPMPSTDSVGAIPSNKKRSRQSDDESDEAPPVKRQNIRTKSLDSPRGLATRTSHGCVTVPQVANASSSSSSSALNASMSASSFDSNAPRPLGDDEEEL